MREWVRGLKVPWQAVVMALGAAAVGVVIGAGARGQRAADPGGAGTAAVDTVAIQSKRTSPKPAVTLAREPWRKETGAEIPSGETAAMAELAREVADLRRQVASLQDATVDETFTRSSGSAALEREHRSEVEAREQRFYRETADWAWAEQASGVVLDALESPEVAELEVVDLECRSQTCRMELAPSGTDKMLPLVLNRIGEVLPDAAASRVEHPDGSQTVVVHLTALGTASHE